MDGRTEGLNVKYYIPSLFFEKARDQRNSFRNTTKKSNYLDPDQDQPSETVDPDLGPNCLQRLSADGIY